MKAFARLGSSPKPCPVLSSLQNRIRNLRIQDFARYLLSPACLLPFAASKACTLGRIVWAFKGCLVSARYFIQSTNVSSSALDRSCWEPCASLRGRAVPCIHRCSVKYRCSIPWAFAAAAIDLCWSPSYAVFAAVILASSSAVMGRLLVFGLGMKKQRDAASQLPNYNTGQGIVGLRNFVASVMPVLGSGSFLSLSSLSIVTVLWNFLFGCSINYARYGRKFGVICKVCWYVPGFCLCLHHYRNACICMLYLCPLKNFESEYMNNVI